MQSGPCDASRKRTGWPRSTRACQATTPFLDRKVQSLLPEVSHEAEVSADRGCDHGRLDVERLRSTGREARSSLIPDLLRSQGAGRVRAWRCDDPFLLVSDRAPHVRERAQAGPQ